jgi:predicted nucleic acid-binding protein
MIVLLDTSVVSLTFRRRETAVASPHEAQIVDAAKRLVLMRRAFLIGMVRQECLTGLKSDQQFDRLRTLLDGFPYLVNDNADHDFSAQCFNKCRSKGIAAGDADMLICATAIRHDAKILTVYHDFVHYARCLPIQLYELGDG